MAAVFAARAPNLGFLLGEVTMSTSGRIIRVLVGALAFSALASANAANTCSGVCGHYTQIVWRATLKLGCAISHCPGQAFPNAIVCNYGPGGNPGGRPY